MEGIGKRECFWLSERGDVNERGGLQGMWRAETNNNRDKTGMAETRLMTVKSAGPTTHYLYFYTPFFF
jgi:hypothetical protein